MNILITGSTGFVGRYLIPTLQKEGIYNLICVSRDIEKAKMLYGDTCINYISASELYKIQEYSPECVIHLAAYLSSKNDSDTLYSLLDSNVVWGVELLNALKNCHTLKLFINLGTFAEYRFGPSTIDNAYLYSATKTAFKQLLQYYADLSGYKFIHVVPYTIYGGEDSQKKIIDFIKDSFDASHPVLMTKGEQVLDFIHVKDVVSFLKFAVTHLDALVRIEDIDYHLGTGIGTSVRDLAAMMEAKYDRLCNIEWGGIPYRERDVMYAVAPIAKLLMLGWRPTCKLEDYL